MNVLLLHAWPVDERMWEPQLAALRAAGYEAVAPRLYGRGDSIDGWASGLLAEIDGPLVPVGASMGGYTALAIARRAPERVLGVVLSGSRAAADSDEQRNVRDERIAALRSEGVPDELGTDVPAEDLAVAYEAIRDRPDATGTVAAFGGPVLVCIGDRDEIVSVEEARSVADTALRGALEVFEGAGHLLSTEQPERFNDVLLEFLGQWRT